MSVPYDTEARDTAMAEPLSTGFDAEAYRRGRDVLMRDEHFGRLSPEEHSMLEVLIDDAHVPDAVDGESLAWTLRQIGYARSRIHEIETTVEVEVQRLHDWKERRTAADRRRILLLEASAKAYAAARREANGIKTIDTPYGRVSSRTQLPEVRVDNEAALHEWAQAEGFVREIPATWKPDMVQIRARALSGEDIPGVSVHDREPSFTVEVTP